MACDNGYLGSDAKIVPILPIFLLVKFWLFYA
jgi:hypothetical protein